MFSEWEDIEAFSSNDGKIWIISVFLTRNIDKFWNFGENKYKLQFE